MIRPIALCTIMLLLGTGVQAWVSRSSTRRTSFSHPRLLVAVPSLSTSCLFVSPLLLVLLVITQIRKCDLTLESSQMSSDSAVGQLPVNRYFQLEEMEDKEKCVTELFLNWDKSVQVGESDGPEFLSATGRWDYKGNQLSLTLKRTYSSGRERSQETDVGEFEYSTERVFVGDAIKVGSKLAFQGTVHMVDEVFGDEEVGYFEMIDTTEEHKKPLQ